MTRNALQTAPKAQKSANVIDQHVGSRMRAQRLLLGMSQEHLAHAIGLTFQQVQKYEKGRNRIGAGRLSHIATVLKVPVSFFYEGAPGTPQPEPLAEVPELDRIAGFLATPDGLQLVRSFLDIKDDQLRRRVLTLIATISGTAAPKGRRTARALGLSS